MITGDSLVRLKPTGPNQHFARDLGHRARVVLDAEVFDMPGVEGRLQLRDTRHELLLQHSRLTKPDSLLHRVEPGPQPADHDLRPWDRCPKALALGWRCPAPRSGANGSASSRACSLASPP